MKSAGTDHYSPDMSGAGITGATNTRTTASPAATGWFNAFLNAVIPGRKFALDGFAAYKKGDKLAAGVLAWGAAGEAVVMAITLGEGKVAIVAVREGVVTFLERMSERQFANALAEQGVAKGATQALSVEGKALLTANPVGSALKADPAHRAATFMREEDAANGTNFAITGGDGVTRTLTQVPGGFNGVAGRYEYIVDSLNNLTHQMFVRGGSVNGIPIKP